MKTSWWVLLTLVPLGLGSGPAFLYAYRSTNERRWLRVALTYGGLSAGSVAAIAVVGEVDEESVWRDVAAITYVGVWLVSIGHAFLVRKRVVTAAIEQDEASQEDAELDKTPWAQRPFARRFLFPIIGLGCLVGSAVFAVRGLASGSELMQYMKARRCEPGRVTGCIGLVDAEITRVYSEFNSRSADDYFVVLLLPSGRRTSEVAFSADYDRLLEGYEHASVSIWKMDPIEISNGSGYLPTTLHPAFATYSDVANAFTLVAFGIMLLVAAATLEMKSTKPLYSVALLRPRVLRDGVPGTGMPGYDVVPRMFTRFLIPLMMIASGVVVAKLGFKAGPQVTLISVGLCTLLSLPLVLQGRVSLRLRPDALEYRGTGLLAELHSWEPARFELQGLRGASSWWKTARFGCAGGQSLTGSCLGSWERIPGMYFLLISRSSLLMRPAS